MLLIHATCIAFNGSGVLLRGASGSGKSDLALRSIDAGARLVADDQVVLEARGGALVASAPAALYGMIEARGLGILRIEADAEAEVALIVDLLSSPAGPRPRIERMPGLRRIVMAGIGVPTIELNAFEASALSKLRFALMAAAEPNRLL
jgi:serine kinase of HPr protein (carbohydrate metabolism regulator)